MSKQFINIQVASNLKKLSSKEDNEVCFILDVKPSDNLNHIAKNRSAHPHLSMLLDRSHSMLAVVDDDADLIYGKVYQEDGQTWQGVHRKDGKALTTLLDRMVNCAQSTSSKMKAKDHISIAHFSSDMSKVQSFQGHQKDLIQAAFNEVKSGKNYGTNMVKALQSLLKHLKSNTQRPTSVLLFTDGMPDANTNKKVINLAKKYAAAGIELHALGYGDGLNMHFLNQLTSAGNGTMMHGRSHVDMMNHFQNYLKTVQSASISDVELEIKFNPCVIPQGLYLGHPQQKLIRKLKSNEHTIKVPIGHLESGNWKTLLLKCKVQKEFLKSNHLQDLLDVKLTYKVPSHSLTERDHVSYKLNVQDTVQRDRTNDHNIEMVFLKSEEAIFHDLVDQNKTSEAIELAQQLYHAYRSLDTHEADHIADSFMVLLEKYKKEGKIPAFELNNVTMTSSTTASNGPWSESASQVMTNSDTHIPNENASHSETQVIHHNTQNKSNRKTRSRRRPRLFNFDNV